MIPVSKLVRESDSLIKYIQRYVSMVGAEHKGEALALFDTLNKVFPHWAVMSCPMVHPELEYASENCINIFGYNNEYMQRNARMENYFRHVHPDDQEGLYPCFAFLRNFLETVSSDDHHRYRCILHYRFCWPDGRYVYLHDEKAVLRMNNSSSLYYALIRDVSDHQRFGGVKLELFEFDERLVKIKEFNPLAVNGQLSKRERELVNLIRQGFSTKEIAWQLNISHHTVRNIKSRLFEKLNVSNSIEMLNIAG